jgi:hypothetical protein
MIKGRLKNAYRKKFTLDGNDERPPPPTAPPASPSIDLCSDDSVKIIHFVDQLEKGIKNPSWSIYDDMIVKKELDKSACPVEDIIN